MKKLGLLLLVIVTMFACAAPETKTADASAAPTDPETGTFTSLDDKSQKVKELLEAYMNNDSTKIYEYYVDSVQIFDQMAANQENGKTKANPGGRAGFAANERMDHDYFSDIKVTTDNIKTFVFADGRVYTAVWCMWTGTGKFTNASISAPLHLALIWEGDKIVTGYRYADPSSLYLEVAASQTK
jgi:hypothetical protein|uniref:hypothetical protein n=1 Tax=Algoriphagus sp. TaxID=1872435 RepID=UPI004047DF86